MLWMVCLCVCVCVLSMLLRINELENLHGELFVVRSKYTVQTTYVAEQRQDHAEARASKSPTNMACFPSRCESHGPSMYVDSR